MNTTKITIRIKPSTKNTQTIGVNENNVKTIVKRQLGKNGPFVSPIGLGAMGMSVAYTTNSTDEEEHLKVLNTAIDMGCTFWDTADIYGPFTNEELIAKVLKTRRNEVFICTKFGLKVGNNKLDICGTPEYVKQSCDDSLKRLGIDQIDLYYQHRPDPNVEIEETVKAMAELVKEGKVKYLGLSECTADQIRRAYKIHPIHAYQVEFSPWHRNIETDGRLQACRELGIAIIAYSPLGRGFLTGAIRSVDDLKDGDWRKNNPKFQPGTFEKNFKLVEAFEKLAAKKGVKPSQLCLAWVLSHGTDFIPIPGTKRLSYLEENWKSKDVTLSAEELAEINQIISEIPIEGAQY